MTGALLQSYNHKEAYSHIAIIKIGVYHFFKEIRLIIGWRIEYTPCDNELKEDLHHG